MCPNKKVYNKLSAKRWPQTFFSFRRISSLSWGVGCDRCVRVKGDVNAWLERERWWKRAVYEEHPHGIRTNNWKFFTHSEVSVSMSNGVSVSKSCSNHISDSKMHTLPKNPQHWTIWFLCCCFFLRRYRINVKKIFYVWIYYDDGEVAAILVLKSFICIRIRFTHFRMRIIY